MCVAQIPYLQRPHMTGSEAGSGGHKPCRDCRAAWHESIGASVSSQTMLLDVRGGQYGCVVSGGLGFGTGRLERTTRIKVPASLTDHSYSLVNEVQPELRQLYSRPMSRSQWSNDAVLGQAKLSEPRTMAWMGARRGGRRRARRRLEAAAACGAALPNYHLPCSALQPPTRLGNEHFMNYAHIFADSECLILQHQVRV